MPETIQIDDGGCIYHQLSTPPGPHRCSWIGYSTLGMHKLLIVTARQGKKISCFVYPFGCVLVVALPTRYFLNNDTTL